MGNAEALILLPLKTKLKYEKGKLLKGLVSNKTNMNIIKYSLACYLAHVSKEYKNLLQNLLFTRFLLSNRSPRKFINVTFSIIKPEELSRYCYREAAVCWKG